MTRTLRHDVVGLPQSGKTTYLAALWHLVSAADAPAGLRLRLAVSDTSYLDTIANQWRRCERMERTRQADATYIDLHLHDPSTGHHFDLHFPDMAGEGFEEQLFAREIGNDHAEWLNHLGGTLLFLTADKSPDVLDISDFENLLGEDNGRVTLGAAAPSEPADAGVDEWTAKSMTEQAKLVELLQIAAHLDINDARRGLAVLVSAWDVLSSETNITPEDWLRREKPLLWQYLEANSSTLDWRIYGISAQGGDLEQAESKGELLDIINPSERIICIGPDGADHDITRPIQWLNEQGRK